METDGHGGNPGQIDPTAFRAIYDTLPAPVWVVGGDGRFRYANPAAAAACGFPPDERGRSIWEHLVGEDHLAWATLADTAMAGDGRARLRLKDPGTDRETLTEVMATRVIWAGLPAVLAMGVAVDADGAAPGTGSLPAEMLHAMPDAVLVCGLDGIIRQANTQARDLFGYLIGELLGQPVEILVPPERVAAHRHHREHFTASTRPHSMFTGPGLSGVRKDGRRVPIEVTLAQVTLEDGPAVVASVRDVTSVRRAERELASAHALVSGVLEAATEQVIIATDLAGRIELFSHGAERILGYAAADVLGQPVSIVSGPGADLVDGPEPERPSRSGSPSSPRRSGRSPDRPRCAPAAEKPDPCSSR